MFDDDGDGCTNYFCACSGTRSYERGICSKCGGLENMALRVEALIGRVMAEHPGIGRSAQATYYEAVHQELAPLARELERENAHLRDALEAIADMASWHTNDEADPDDTSPDDMVAHVNGLIRKRCKAALMGPNVEVGGD